MSEQSSSDQTTQANPSTTPEQSQSTPGTPKLDEQAPRVETLRAQLKQLRAENQRLRQEYAATQRTQYRRTAIGLYLVGGLSVGTALLLPDARRVLFAIGATGLFAGLLTYYLTPERFVAASVSDRLVAANTATLRALIDDLGLQHTQVYVPVDESPETQPSDVLLFIPQASQYDLPDTRTPGVVVPESKRARGLLVVPTGGPLLRELERGATDSLSGTPSLLASQLTDGITDQFDLARTAEAEIAPITMTDADNSESASENSDTSDIPEAGRLTIHTQDPAFEPTSIGHPIASFVAVGMASALDTPVTIIENESPVDGEYHVTVQWDMSESGTHS